MFCSKCKISFYFFELISAYMTDWTLCWCSISFINISTYCTYKFFHSVVLLFLFLLYIKSVPYGYIGGIMRPVVSGRPMMRFMFWMAWPAAPLPMLSITEETIRRWVRASKVGVISQKFVP